MSRPVLWPPVRSFRAEGPTRSLGLGPVHAAENRVSSRTARKRLWNRFLTLPGKDPLTAALRADRIAAVHGWLDELGETGGCVTPFTVVAGEESVTLTPTEPAAKPEPPPTMKSPNVPVRNGSGVEPTQQPPSRTRAPRGRRDT